MPTRFDRRAFFTGSAATLAGGGAAMLGTGCAPDENAVVDTSILARPRFRCPAENGLTGSLPRP